MIGFEVVAAALHVAGRLACDVGEQAASVDAGGVLPAIGMAMPGGRSADVALELAAAMRAALRTWSSDTTTFGAEMRAAADRYEADEQFTEQLFGRQWTLQ
jgi:hypothetical protein